MNNFRFHAYTDIFFGKGQIQNLPEILNRFGKRVLLVYGGGSIKRNGIYDQIQELLKGFEITELSGVEPNPRITTVRKGVELCKEKKIDVVLPVGGGSTIDCSKVIAGGAYYDGDPWDLVLDSKKIGKVLPIVTILTLAATGSEMNKNAVISNVELNEKLGTSSLDFIPQASILDPEYLYTLPAIQTAAGTADIMSHVFENYFKTMTSAFIPDRFAEGILEACIKYGKIALEKPDDYEARANLMWASTMALNGLVGAGNGAAWSCHPIEHELSAFYDVTHGVGLAILTPRWMRYILSENTVDRFVMYAENVWHLPASEDKFALANQAIDLTENFFKECGIPMTLTELGIDDSKFDIMAEKAVKNGGLHRAYVSLDKEDVIKIFKMCQ
ncbi:MAG: iron-containing alcohol dehydrogenase [Lachnospiraceae bacterium]|nr:iron-containing alcohol dehydrogenase [Lachnospiraceae bacterium]